MANDIDLGELQDSLESAKKRLKMCMTNATKAKSTLHRAEDALEKAYMESERIKNTIVDAARALTK